MHSFLCSMNRLRGLVATVVLLCLQGGGAAAQDASPTMGVEELERGQKGYGLSVYSGSEHERFEVEILGVVNNSTPGGSFVLARLSGQNLEQSGVIAGMSGSPVYIEGRLIGAVAFAWPFSHEAVGGITPIGQMRRLSEVELTDVGGQVAAAGLPLALSEVRRESYDVSILEEQVRRLTTPSPGQGGNGLLWSLAGFQGESRSFLERTLTAAAPAGAATGPPVELVPGSSVAGVLVDGDLRMAVTGTVTDRTGDEILAFGHAFLGQGPIRLPMATSEVVTVLSSQLSSFKIANVGEVVGAFDLDRVSGVRGRIGAKVATIPMTVQVSGMGDARFAMELADVPAYLPTMAAIASLGAMDSVSRSGGAQGVDIQVTWQLADHGEVVVAQSFDGPGAAFSAAIYTLLMTNYLVNNVAEATRLESLEVSLEQHPVPRSERVVGGFSNRSAVRPGDQVGLTLDILPYQGERYQRKVSVELPDDLPAGRYTLIVGDGVTVDTVRQIVEPVVPATLSQSLDIVRRFHSNRDLVVIGLVPSAGLSLSGRVLPQLPGSIRQLWGGAAPPGGALPLTLAVVHEMVTSLERPLVGGVRIDLDVERANTALMQPMSPPVTRGRWASRTVPGQGVMLTIDNAADVLWELENRDEEPK
jgi:hypothetical protein